MHNCPKCQGELRVKDSRPKEKNTIYRRRECVECGSRYTTYEFEMGPEIFNAFIKHETSALVKLEKIKCILSPPKDDK